MTIAELIPHDKALHALGGSLVFAVARLALLVAGWNSSTARVAAITVAVIVAIGKELYDLLHRDRHTPDVKDTLATAAGALLAMSCAFTWR